MIMDELEDVFYEEDLGLESVVTDEPIQIPPDEDDDNFLPLDDVKKEDTLIDTLLKNKGFNDGKILIKDENNTESEINFYDLSREEQLDILSSFEESNDVDLDESEVDFLNNLRTNGLSVDEFLQQYKESVLQEAGKTPEISYDIDAYNDQELFLLDLKNKYDLTDEELLAELEKELTNEEIFNKKTARLRTEYKQLEDEYKSNQQQEFQRQKEEEYNQYAQKLVDVAISIPEFHGIDLEDDDKNETLSYLLDLDDKGVSNFYKDLNNPTKLYEAAWYLRYGKEAFDAIKSAYETEINKLKKTTDKPRVVVQNTSNKTNIHDLF